MTKIVFYQTRELKEVLKFCFKRRTTISASYLIIFVPNCIHVLDMAVAFQLVLEAEKDDDLPVSYMQKLI